MKKVIPFICLAILLAACEGNEIKQRSPENKIEAMTFNAHLGYGSISVSKVELHDGTICYVAQESGHGMAMQCFQKKEK